MKYLKLLFIILIAQTIYGIETNEKLTVEGKHDLYGGAKFVITVIKNCSPQNKKICDVWIDILPLTGKMLADNKISLSWEYSELSIEETNKRINEIIESLNKGKRFLSIAGNNDIQQVYKKEIDSFLFLDINFEIVIIKGVFTPVITFRSTCNSIDLYLQTYKDIDRLIYLLQNPTDISIEDKYKTEELNNLFK